MRLSLNWSMTWDCTSITSSARRWASSVSTRFSILAAGVPSSGE